MRVSAKGRSPMTNGQLPAEIKDVTRKVLDFAREIIDITKPLVPLGEEAAGIALDWLRFYRYQNTLKIRDRVHEIWKERSVTKTIPIPVRLGIPLLEAASMEDDPTLQEMWAGLVANVTDPNRRQKLRKVFSAILSDFEPIDSIVLRYLAAHWDHDSSEKGEEIQIKVASIELEIGTNEIQLSLHNLARLGCLRIEPPRTLGGFVTGSAGRPLNTAPSILSSEGDFYVTTLAVDLLETCET
jgi:hypothetical protein